MVCLDSVRVDVAFQRSKCAVSCAISEDIFDSVEHKSEPCQAISKVDWVVMFRRFELMDCEIDAFRQTGVQSLRISV